MSNELPSVVSTSVPLAGAVQRYQIEAAPPLPPWLGSPVCRVAVVVLPVTVVPVTVAASWKSSFDRPAAGVAEADAEYGLWPALLTAATRNAYDVPLVRPVISAEVRLEIPSATVVQAPPAVACWIT